MGMMTDTRFLTGANARHSARMAAGAPAGPEWAAALRTEVGTLPWSRLRRVIEYVEAHLDRDLRLAQLATVACMSPYHFARLFRRSTGMPPCRFVTWKRIECAIALLAAPDLSVARIARIVGFRTSSHFTTVFRRMTGIPPSTYRASHVSDGGRSPGGNRR